MNEHKKDVDVETALKMIHEVKKRKNSSNSCAIRGRQRFEVKLPSGQRHEISRRDLELMKFCWEQGWINLEQARGMFFSRLDLWSEVPYNEIHRLIDARLMREEEDVDFHTYSVTRMGVNLLKRLKIITDLSAIKKINQLPLEGDILETDARIIFARELKIRNWISKRLLIAQGSPYKDFDGLIQEGGANYVFRAEFFIRGQKYFQKQFKQFRPRNSKSKDCLFYIARHKEIKQKILNLACRLDRVFATTLQDLLTSDPLCFENGQGGKICFARKGSACLDTDY